MHILCFKLVCVCVSWVEILMIFFLNRTQKKNYFCHQFSTGQNGNVYSFVNCFFEKRERKQKKSIAIYVQKRTISVVSNCHRQSIYKRKGYNFLEIRRCVHCHIGTVVSGHMWHTFIFVLQCFFNFFQMFFFLSSSSLLRVEWKEEKKNPKMKCVCFFFCNNWRLTNNFRHYISNIIYNEQFIYLFFSVKKNIESKMKWLWAR